VCAPPRSLAQPFLSHVLIPKGFVHDRVSAMAKEMAAEYSGTCPHILCVLKGASVFAMKLIDQLHAAFSAHPSAKAGVPFTFAFCRLKSYEGVESTGSVSITGVDSTELRGRRVIVVEDIVDTGLSMSKLLPVLRGDCGVADARVCTLLEKRTDKSCGLRANYCGFSIPDAFVVGYGLDYNEAFRDLDHICVVNAAGVAEFREFSPGSPTTADA